jgi:hypothetical protein
MTKDGIREMISRQLKRVYDPVILEPIPPDIKERLQELR